MASTHMMNQSKPKALQLPLVPPLIRPGQKLVWEYSNPTDGKPFFYDQEKHISSWERPTEDSSIVIINA